jgi:hypothetical protein
MRQNPHNRFKDGLTEKRRRRFLLKIIFILASLLSIGAAVFYFLFISSFLQIKDVEIIGLEKVEIQEISKIVDLHINRADNLFFVRFNKNIYLFDGDSLKEEIKTKYPVIKSVEVEKNIPHNIKVITTERIPEGIWCGPDGDCRYFDEENVFWGQAIRSTGSLLMSIDDLRREKSGDDMLMMDAIRKITGGLGKLNIKITRIDIPEGSIGDIKIHLPDYYILFNVDTEIDRQIDVLSIFLREQEPDFKPEYLDLRIKERVYYR